MPYRIRNKNIKTRNKVKDDMEVRKQKWRWAGHLYKTTDDIWNRIMLEWTS